jgi:hypothetical protein
MFADTQGQALDWPPGVKLFGDKMYLKELLCVPLGLQMKLIRDHHSFLGHCGFQRLWDHMMVNFEFADLKSAKNYSKRVMGMCEVCQAVQRPRNLKSPMEWTPIPPKIMVSVCLDIFHMPLVEYQGVNLQ